MMFRTHKITSNTISIKNLVLLFFTIVFWFASVITLADIEITSDISNARQTIGRITITSDGTDNGTKEMEISSGGIFINPAILSGQQTFSGKVLGIDSQGNLIYVTSENLIISWAWLGGDTWTLSGENVYRFTGNVGIGTNTPTNKLHIVNSWATDVYIEEKAAGFAANLNLKNPIRSRAIGWDSDPDIFYIGFTSWSIYFAINPLGFVGIGTTQPTAPLQVVGNIIGWWTGSIITGTNSTIAGGNGNSISGDNSFIWGGEGSKVIGKFSAIVMGTKSNSITNADNSFIGAGNDHEILWGNFSSIVGGQNNIISGASYATIAGGIGNEIYGNKSVILWWQINKIWGQYSSIPWWYLNTISWSYSMAIGSKATNNYNNSFIRNDSTTAIRNTMANNQFIIYAANGVGINTNTPGVYALSVSGDIAAGGYYYLSDRRYKEHLQAISTPLDKILSLHGYMFDWKSNKKADIGVIAQEVEQVFPALVATNTDGYKSVKYGNLVAPIIEAIRELNTKITTLRENYNHQQERIEKLEAKISAMEERKQ